MQDKNEFRLPVNPELYEHKLGKLNTVIIVPELGEVNLLGKSKLSEISITSFFPAQHYHFCEYSGFPDSKTCVDIIEEFMEKGQVRLLITGTKVNRIYYIENFTYGERDGTHDIYYTIELKEYRPLKIKSLDNPVSNQKPLKFRFHVVKEGESLWSIAKKYLGDGSKYKDIVTLNKLRNPEDIKAGRMLKLW